MSPAPAPSAGTAELSGDLRVHDPALAVTDDGWFVYCTGGDGVGDGCLQVRRSDDGIAWEFAGTVWETRPAWLAEAVPGVANLWAPELVEHDGTWYLYYAASTFGSNRSVIALATNTTLDPRDPGYAWVDRGPVIASGEGDDFNAIDPGVVVDADGTPWMSFGSFWSGIRMVPLAWPDGGVAPGWSGAPLRLADRELVPNAVEAPYVLRHEGAYYLFVSQDFCCRGVDSTYRIAVGRAESVAGPYVDRDGVELLAGGGTVLLETDGARIGPGGQSISASHLAFHYYDGNDDGRFRLEILRLAWEGGWPAVQWKERA